MKWLVKFCIVSAVLGMAFWTEAAGLSTTFVDVVMKSARVGQSQEAYGPEGKGLIVRNLGDVPIQISVEALAPAPKQMKPGAQTLPDLSWVRFNPARMIIPAHEEKEVKVTVHVPKQEKYSNQTYQVMVWTRGETMHTQSIRLNAGLLSCLRIQTTR
jgi:hypothetical protein